MLVFPLDHYSASPLAPWLLPSNHLDADLQKTFSCLTSSVVVWRLLALMDLPSTRWITTVRARTTENTAPVLWAACVLRPLPGSGSISHIIFNSGDFFWDWVTGTQHISKGLLLLALCFLRLPDFLYDFVFEPEDGRSMFLRNRVRILPNYMALHPRRSYSSIPAVRTSNPTQFSIQLDTRIRFISLAD
jgi:hypothetical protein